MKDTVCSWEDVVLPALYPSTSDVAEFIARGHVEAVGRALGGDGGRGRPRDPKGRLGKEKKQ